MNATHAIIAICAVLILGTILGIYFRERSWNHYAKGIQAKISAAEFDFESSLLLMQIKQLNVEKCSPIVGEESAVECLKSNGTDNYLGRPCSTEAQYQTMNEFIVRKSPQNIAAFFNTTESNLNTESKLAPKRAYFDRTGLLIILLIVLAKGFEFRYLHNGIFDIGRCYVDFDSNREFKHYVRLWTPVTTMTVSGLLCISAALAWIGIIGRPSFSIFSLRVVLCYAFSVPIFVGGCNAISIIAYLPRTRDEFFASVKVPSWWQWLLFGIIGAESLETAFVVLIKAIVVILMVWPYRYLYLYKETLTTSSYVVDIFIVNMICQGSYILFCLSTMGIKVFGSPYELRNHKILRYLNPMLIDTDSAYVNVFTLLLMGNAIIALVRILWFAFTGGCGYWGAFVMMLLLITHYILPLSNLALISTYVTRVRLISSSKQAFIESFTSDIMTSLEASSEDAVNSVEDYKSLSSSLFDALVDRATRSYTLGAGPITYSSYNERSKSEDKSKDDTATDSGNDDSSLRDMALALEYARVEFTMTFAKYEDALVKAALADNFVKGEDIGSYVSNLTAEQRLALTKATLSLLIGAQVH